MSGTSYNGYTWRQRAKIIPAHVQLTGSRDPFPGAPCSMCGDPNRAEAEWHSEDYSEPFIFEAPASYPVCKPCHGRLHKRFNAPAGEWELFCRHLDAGGYGAEFAKRYSVAERRVLAERLVQGGCVDLQQMRPAPNGAKWWRNLSLDPETLDAPWARPRPLRPRPASDAFVDALDQAQPSEREWSMLNIHASAARRTMTMRAISAAVGDRNPQAANLLYGSLAKRLAKLLGWKVDRRADGTPIWMSLFAEGWNPAGRESEWTMVPSLAEAIDVRASRP